jgi:hypothetical protein
MIFRSMQRQNKGGSIMFILKIIGKILVLPAILALIILLGIVKAAVGIYNFARGLFGLLIGVMIVLTMYYYQDWLQIGMLAGIAGISVAVLVAGLFLELLLESAICRLGGFVLS